MLKAQRDSAISGLSDHHRQQLRQIVDGIKEARLAHPSNGQLSARELASGQQANLPAEVRAALAAILVRDETGPNVGELAPDFCLKRLGSEERVRLSDFRGRRPVALAFGSYT